MIAFEIDFTAVFLGVNLLKAQSTGNVEEFRIPERQSDNDTELAPLCIIHFHKASLLTSWFLG